MVRRVTASAAPESDLFASQTCDPQSAVFLTLSASDAGTWTAFMPPSSLVFAFRHSPLGGYIGRKVSASGSPAMKRRPVDSTEAVRSAPVRPCDSRSRPNRATVRSGGRSPAPRSRGGSSPPSGSEAGGEGNRPHRSSYDPHTRSKTERPNLLTAAQRRLL